MPPFAFLPMNFIDWLDGQASQVYLLSSPTYAALISAGMQ